MRVLIAEMNLPSKKRVVQLAFDIPVLPDSVILLLIGETASKWAENMFCIKPSSVYAFCTSVSLCLFRLGPLLLFLSATYFI